MTISIVNIHNLHDVTFFNDQIQTLVTHHPATVESWIIETQRIHSKRLHHLIVGLDIEWRPNTSKLENPVATLQLCVGHRCLIFQILHSPSIPPSLITFLGNVSYTFVGVGIAIDVKKLVNHHGIVVVNVVDLSELAEEKLGLRNASLKTLAKEVMGKEVPKPEEVSRSYWDNRCLTPAQVQYACVDAFMSFEIGRKLNASGSSGFWGFFKNLGFGWSFMLFIGCLWATGYLKN